MVGNFSSREYIWGPGVQIFDHKSIDFKTVGNCVPIKTTPRYKLLRQHKLKTYRETLNNGQARHLRRMSMKYG